MMNHEPSSMTLSDDERRLLFTSPPEPAVWNDAVTGLESRSLGGVECRRALAAVGLKVMSEYEDEGQNHYFDAIKGPTNRNRSTGPNKTLQPRAARDGCGF